MIVKVDALAEQTNRYRKKSRVPEGRGFGLGHSLWINWQLTIP
jgi:hypothetical protein